MVARPAPDSRFVTCTPGSGAIGWHREADKAEPPLDVVMWAAVLTGSIWSQASQRCGPLGRGQMLAPINMQKLETAQAERQGRSLLGRSH